MLFDVYDKCADALSNGPGRGGHHRQRDPAGFVGESDGEFKLVGEQFTEEPYGIGIEKGDVEFCEFINETLARERGRLPRGLGGHRRQGRGHRGARAPRARRPAPELSVRHRSRCRSPRHRDRLTRKESRWRPSPTTWTCSGPGSCVPWASACGPWSARSSLGTVIAACRVSPVPSLRWFGTAWVTVIRNCPLTVVLFFMRLRPAGDRHQRRATTSSASVALIIYTSAFVCEAMRSGINSVSAGPGRGRPRDRADLHPDLGRSCCRRRSGSSVPPLGSVIIAMFKNSAVVGAFGVGRDLFSVGKNLTSAQGYDVHPGPHRGRHRLPGHHPLPRALLLGVLERKVAIAR